MALVEVDNLSVLVPIAGGMADAVRGVSFSLERGDTLGLIGESGSGKTLTAMALIGLLPEAAQASGRIRFDGQDIAGMPDSTLCRIRGNRIGTIFQDPMTALDPLRTIARQVAEPLIEHHRLPAQAARGEAVGLLERVGLPRRQAEAYPHQLSGGQLQRAMIAMALACGPDLLIADEPTTALDVTTQREILDLVAGLVQAAGMSLLLISHDLGVIAENAARMLVMYGGTIVESGPTEAVLARLAHPYTRGLFAARPRLGAGRGARLATIAGASQSLAERPTGCPFAGRCPLTIDACRSALPPLFTVGAGHAARCIRLDAAAELA